MKDLESVKQGLKALFTYRKRITCVSVDVWRIADLTAVQGEEPLISRGDSFRSCGCSIADRSTGILPIE